MVQIVRRHGFNKRMDKEVDAGKEKHQQPGQHHDSVVLNGIEGDRENDSLCYAHCEG